MSREQLLAHKCLWEQGTDAQGCCFTPPWPGEEDPTSCKNCLDEKHPVSG